MKMLQLLLITALMLCSTFQNPIKSQTKKPVKVQSSTNSKLKKLKAVIVVSDVDGEDPNGWWNKEYIALHKQNAKYLRQCGVQVFEFYHPNTKWKDIVKACNGANIFIYSGHGSNQGINYPIGGICISEGIRGGSEIKAELKLHKNAIAIFIGACGAAGSSAADKADIGYKEAQKRVSEYAYPFISNTNGAYLANNNSDWVIPFFKRFFSGKTLKEIYKKDLLGSDKLESIAVYRYDNSYEVAISSNLPITKDYQLTTTINDVVTVEKVKSHKEYHIAYVSKPNYCIKDLVK